MAALPACLAGLVGGTGRWPVRGGCQQIFLESTDLLVAVDQDAAENQKAAGGESERAATLAGSRLCDRSAPRRYGEWNVPSNVGSEPTPPQPPPLPLTSKLFD